MGNKRTSISKEEVKEIIRLIKCGYSTRWIAEHMLTSQKAVMEIKRGKHRFNKKPIPTSTVSNAAPTKKRLDSAFKMTDEQEKVFISDLLRLWLTGETNIDIVFPANTYPPITWPRAIVAEYDKNSWVNKSGWRKYRIDSLLQVYVKEGKLALDLEQLKEANTQLNKLLDMD